MTVDVENNKRKNGAVSLIIAMLEKYVSERMIVVFEQIAYTGFSLLVLAVTLYRYDPEVSAFNLGLVALLNFPVPFHAIQLGWRSEIEDSIWFGSGATQTVLLLMTITSMLVFSYASSLPINISTVILMILGGVAAVWSNGIRWIFIKLGKFPMLACSSLALLPMFLALEYLSPFPDSISIFASVVITKACFTLILFWRAIAEKAMTLAGPFKGRSVDFITAMLAFARFIRTNGVFTIVAIFSPNAAIAGRIVQQAISFCRVFQNPLANHTFFHQRTFFGAAIKIQILFGTVSAVIFLFAGLFLFGNINPVIGGLAVFCSTLGFVGSFVLRYRESKGISVFVETTAAIVFLFTALFFADQDGFLIGIIISECLLFVAGAMVAKLRR
ncbi:hypothetical protein [Parasphingorhabdus flavimaris]|uniref:hypothetical protein n=1 Tax=Parasphingorhabdus flavimaris TaxID=266812 RepID=UPI003002610E